MVETLSSLTGATFQKHFPGYGLWKGTVASYIHEKLAFECIYEDGYKEYNSLKQLLKYNVSKKYRIPKSMLQKLLGEKQTPNEKIHKSKKTPGTAVKDCQKSEKEEDGGEENNFCTKRH